MNISVGCGMEILIVSKHASPVENFEILWLKNIYLVNSLKRLASRLATVKFYHRNAPKNFQNRLSINCAIGLNRNGRMNKMEDDRNHGCAKCYHKDTNNSCLTGCKIYHPISGWKNNREDCMEKNKNGDCPDFKLKEEKAEKKPSPESTMPQCEICESDERVKLMAPSKYRCYGCSTIFEVTE